MIEPGDDLASIIYNNIIDNNIKIDDGDVIAVAQKVISKAENRYRSLDEIVPSEDCLLYTSPSPRDQRGSRMPSSA